MSQGSSRGKTLRKMIPLLMLLLLVPVLYGWEEKPMVVVIPSFENALWYQKNLDSVFGQNYSNYRVIYINDCSPDGTGDLVREYLAERGLEDRCILIDNQMRYGPLFNRYKAIHECADNEIIVLLDGDDWFAHPEVLSYLNTIYCQQNVWLTVGNAYRSTSGQKIGHRDYTDLELEQFGFRQLGFRGVHPRTFYAGLFKKIKLKDLIHGGRFLTVATDVAFMLPMFEMARHHYRYIEDILYVYNTDNVNNLFKSHLERQIYFDLLTRNRRPYQELSIYTRFDQPCEQSSELSYLIFMEEPTDFQSFLLEQTINGIEFDTCIKIGNGNPYRRFRQQQYFRAWYSVDIGCSLGDVYQFRYNFKDRLITNLEKTGGRYLLISTNKLLEGSGIDLFTCIEQLEATGAYGVMFGKADELYLKKDSYNVAPWREPMGLYTAHLIEQHAIYKDITDCVGILVRRTDFMELVNRLEIFHPNFYTLLSACNSVIREDSLWLIAHAQEGNRYAYH